MRYILIIALLVSGTLIRTKAQTGGDNTYEFLNLSTSSLVSSLGGMNVSLVADDPGLAYYNPALLRRSGTDMISLNYVNYISGINYGYASYSRYIEKYGTFSAGITYLNYGTFDEANPTGQITGTFRASEYALNLIWAYNIDTLFHIGVNVKPVISHLDKYTSVGLLMDIGGSYESRNGLYSAGLTVRNIGAQLSSYSGVREAVPFEIVAGASAKLQHAPIRFSLTARHLQRYNMIHDSELKDENQNDKYKGISGVSENIMRHLIFSAEFLPTENFYISTSYNYLRRKELMVPSKTSTVGFSIGAGIKLSRLEISLSRSKYHLAGSLTNISLLIKPGLYK
jgi:hypothetical protein